MNPNTAVNRNSGRKSKPERKMKPGRVSIIGGVHSYNFLGFEKGVAPSDFKVTT